MCAAYHNSGERCADPFVDEQGEFDQKGGKRTKWGTKEEYLECVQELKKHGVVSYIGKWLKRSNFVLGERLHRIRPRRYLFVTFGADRRSTSDAVLNHKAGADFAEKFNATEVDNEDRNKEVSGQYEIEGWTGFNFPGRKGEDGKLKYSQQEYHHYHFTGVDFDNKTGKNAIFKIQGDGKTWAEDVGASTLCFAVTYVAHPTVRQMERRARSTT